MASKLNQPTGFIKLTNVAFIKYKVDKHKFEIACYKNKAINWRNGVEKDISEVLQSEEVYENATHGLIAKKDQLKKVFPQMEKIDIIKMILDKGELQVSEKEREMQMSNLQNDIINFVQERVVHPQSQRQFSIEQITQAIQDIHFNVKSDQPAKKQALLCIQQLQQKYDIQRAKMKIGVTANQKHQQKLDDLFIDLQIKELEVNQINEKEIQYSLILLPHLYRPLIDGLKKLTIHVTTEVLENNIINKTVQDISNAGNVELKIKEGWQEESEEKQEQENNEEKKIKNKKQRQKQHKKLLKEQEELTKQQKEDQLSMQLQKLNMLSNQNLPNNFANFNEENQQLLIDIQQSQKLKNQTSQSKKEEEEKSQTEKSEVSEKPEVKKGVKKCTTCVDAYFDDAAEYRTHFKSEWHVCNIKRKSQSLALYTQQQFQIAQLDEEFNKK